MICEAMFKLKKNGEPNYRCYCHNPELIENYDNAVKDTTKTWICHHKLEKDYTREELISMNLYYHRPPAELIFVEPSEHKKLPHKDMKSKLSNGGRKGGFGNRKKVQCIETGIIYTSFTDAEKRTGISHSHISQCCQGKRKTSGGYHWRYI